MDREIFISLRNELVNLYPTIEDSRRVIEDAGISSLHIAFNSKAVNNWDAILREAKNRNKVGDIIKVVSADFQENQVIKKIIEDNFNG